MSSPSAKACRRARRHFTAEAAGTRSVDVAEEGLQPLVELVERRRLVFVVLSPSTSPVAVVELRSMSVT